MKKLWITLTYAVFTILIIIPLVRIFIGSWEEGFGGFVDALRRPQSLHALYMTGLIVVTVTFINTLFGVMLALYLVRAT